jgi:hypothetical protein
MGEVWDHPNRKKVWPGSGGVYSGEGGFTEICFPLTVYAK